MGVFPLFFNFERYANGSGLNERLGEKKGTSFLVGDGNGRGRRRWSRAWRDAADRLTAYKILYRSIYNVLHKYEQVLE